MLLSAFKELMWYSQGAFYRISTVKTLIITLRLGDGILSEQHFQGLEQLELCKVVESAIQEIIWVYMDRYKFEG